MTSGKLPPFVDPEIARDFIHTDDVCDALLLLASSKVSDPSSIFNLASGVQTTIRDVADIARARFGIVDQPKWGSMPNRGWDTRCWVGDPSKMARELGWRASLNFEEGFGKTADWYQDNRTWLDPSCVDA